MKLGKLGIVSLRGVKARVGALLRQAGSDVGSCVCPCSTQHQATARVTGYQHQRDNLQRLTMWGSFRAYTLI
jgi:tetrahydromethanopterin S-methyltransferase subunit E